MSESPKSFEPGDIIQKNCTPIFKVSKIWADRSGKICDVCFKSCPENEDPQTFVMKKCGGCNLMFYCSKECRAKDWKNGHKLECKSQAWKKTFEPLKNLNGQPTPPEVKSDLKLRAQLFRAMAFLQLNPKLLNRQFTMYDGSTRSFNDWMGQQKKINLTGLKEAKCSSKLAKDIVDEKLDTGAIVADQTFFMKMAEIILLSNLTSPNRNLFGLRNCRCKEIEIFPQLANLQHSCKSTAVLSRNLVGENMMDIRAIATIPEGESPTISYFSDLYKCKVRKSAWCKHWNFGLKCEHCLSNSDDSVSVDFDKLKYHLEFQKNYILGLDNVWLTYSWQDILRKHEEVIDEMNKIYHDYDEPLSLQFFYAALAITDNFANREPDDVEYQYISEIRDLFSLTWYQLNTTYGEAHPQYQHFKEVLFGLMVKLFFGQKGLRAGNQ